MRSAISAGPRSAGDRAGDQAANEGDLVPVAKGNGYGLGNVRCVREAQRLGLTRVAVGTVYEVAEVAASYEVVAPNGTVLEFAPAVVPLHVPPLVEEFVVMRAPVDGDADFGEGRAGLRYRDLIPSRLGGRFIASRLLIVCCAFGFSLDILGYRERAGSGFEGPWPA